MWKWYDSVIYFVGAGAIAIGVLFLILVADVHVARFVKLLLEVRPENKFLRRRVENLEGAVALLAEEKRKLEAECEALRKAFGYRDVP